MDDNVYTEITSENGTAVVVFKKANISEVEEINAVTGRIKDFVEKNRPVSVIFDFEGVKFFSSQVLGMLLDIRATLKKYDCKVVISAINPRLHRVFKITNLDKIFTFFPNRECAVKAANAE
jgi:anti-sigma B factor antagonist